MKRYHNERIIHNVRDGDVPRLLEDCNPGKARPKSWQTIVQLQDIHDINIATIRTGSAWLVTLRPGFIVVKIADYLIV